MEIRRSKAKLTAPLALTSLIDAFSILVLYLLMVTQNGVLDIDLKSTVTIPVAESAPYVETEPLVVRLEKNQFFVKDQRLTEPQLVQLVQGKKQSSVAIQAGKKDSFGQVETLIQVLRESGVEKIELLAERSE
jgi:biopolymer transport protein ExbD